MSELPRLRGPLAWVERLDDGRTGEGDLVYAVVPAPWQHPHIDLDEGLLTAHDPWRLVTVSLPWPPPPPKHEWGHWEPAVMERYEDGTAFGLWRWSEGGVGE